MHTFVELVTSIHLHTDFVFYVCFWENTRDGQHYQEMISAQNKILSKKEKSYSNSVLMYECSCNAEPSEKPATLENLTAFPNVCFLMGKCSPTFPSQQSCQKLGDKLI